MRRHTLSLFGGPELPEAEERLIEALALMACQYLTEGDMLDSLCMSAGESALAVLERYGLVSRDAGGRTAVWTELGRRYLGPTPL